MSMMLADEKLIAQYEANLNTHLPILQKTSLKSLLQLYYKSLESIIRSSSVTGDLSCNGPSHEETLFRIHTMLLSHVSGQSVFISQLSLNALVQIFSMDNMFVSRSFVNHDTPTCAWVKNRLRRCDDMLTEIVLRANSREICSVSLVTTVFFLFHIGMRMEELGGNIRKWIGNGRK